MAIKLILEERGESKALTLEQDAITIGRTADNAVRIQDALSSRHHCKISKGGDGFYVEDLKSRNGTTLNGKPLVEKKLLAVGDRIAVGQSVLHFGAKLEEAAPKTKTKPVRPQSDRTTGKLEKKPEKEKPEKAEKEKPEKPEKAEKGNEKRSRFVLKLVEGGKSVAVPSFPFTIGRKKGVSFQIDEESVSPEHCMLVEDDGIVHVVDLNSESGTLVDGKKVKGRERVKPNAILSLGSVKVKFKDHAGKDAELASDDDLPAASPAPKPVAAVAEEVTNLDDLESDDEARTPAEGMPRPPAKEKSQRRTKPASDRTEKGVAAGEAAALVASEASSGIAETSFSTAAEPYEGGGGGAGIVVLVALLAILGAAVPVARSLFVRENLDPEPTGNLVSNWSFEDPDGFRGWTHGPELKLVATTPYGKRAVAIPASAGDPRPDLRAAEPLTIKQGHVLKLDAAIKTENAAAAVLALEFTSEQRPDWKDLACVAWVDKQDDWRPVGGTLAPPPEATHARVVIFAVGVANGAGNALVDRVSLEEEPAPQGGVSTKGAGLILAANPRGVLTVSRPVGTGERVARIQCALSAGDGRGDLLSLQEAWTPATAASDPGDGGIVADGTLLDTSTGEHVAATVVAKPVGEAVRITWELAKKDLPDKRTVRIVFTIPKARDLAPLELAAQAGATMKLEDAFAQANAPFIKLPQIVELAWGSGADQASIRPTFPVDVEVEKIGDGLRLELVGVPIVKGEFRVAGFDLAKASSLARERVRLLFEQAESSRAAGRLEEARLLYVKIARDFGHEPAVAARARSEAASLEKRADRLLESALAAAEDAEELGVPELARAAKAWAEVLARAFPGASQLSRATSAAVRAEDAARKAQLQKRGSRSRDLVARAAKHREANRMRLARTLYKFVIDTFPADDPAVKDAKERLAAMPPESE